MGKKRSLGLTFIGILFIIRSSLSVGILFLSRSAAISLDMIMLFCFALFGFYAGIGILMLKSSARKLGIGLVAVKMTYDIIKNVMDYNVLVSKFLTPKPFILLIWALGIIVMVVINLWIIYYLALPRIKDQFNRLQPFLENKHSYKTASSMNSKRPLGFTVFGILIIVTSCLELFKLLDMPLYVWEFDFLSKKLIAIRYFFSISFRLLGLYIGFGILRRSELARRLSVFLGIAIICTIYFKHPYYVVYKDVIRTSLLIFGKSMLSNRAFLEAMTKMVMIFSYASDIIFSLALIYYFTRPKVKEKFK